MSDVMSFLFSVSVDWRNVCISVFVVCAVSETARFMFIMTGVQKGHGR